MSTRQELLRTLDFAGFQGKNLGTPTAANDATYADLSTGPADPAAASSPGVSFLAAPADHVHQGVHSVHADASANLYGNVQFASGTGITLTQVGQVITVASAAGAVNKVTFSSDDARSQLGASEEIVWETLVNFDDAGAGAGPNIQVRLTALVNTSAGTGTYQIYVGATTAGSTTGGTSRVSFTSTSTSYEKKTAIGSAFANAGGMQLVQIVLNGSAGGNTQKIRGLSVSIG